jgi:hypothetical protein
MIKKWSLTIFFLLKQNAASPRIGTNEDQAVAFCTSGNKSVINLHLIKFYIEMIKPWWLLFKLLLVSSNFFDSSSPIVSSQYRIKQANQT